MTKNILWSEREEELFDKAWNTTAYSREDLERMFGRSWCALIQKAIRMGFPTRTVIEQRARLEALEKMLKEDHVI